MRLLLAGILCLEGYWGHTQLLHPPVVQPYATSVGLSRNQADAFSFQTNPAALQLLDEPQFGIYGVQPFALPGIASGGLSVALPAGNTHFGGYLHHMGHTSAHQTGFNFSVAQSLGKCGSLGAAFYYRSVAAAGYGSIGMWGAGLGWLLRVSQRLHAGAFVFLPATPASKQNGERLAGYYNLGLGLDLSQQVFIATNLSQTESFQPEVHASISYRMAPRISARLGVQTGTREMFVGAGFLYKKAQLHLFTSLHPRLGFSPGLQLLVGQNKEQE